MRFEIIHEAEKLHTDNNNNLLSIHKHCIILTSIPPEGRLFHVYRSGYATQNSASKSTAQIVALDVSFANKRIYDFIQIKI